ncbi:MAG: glycosyltransferase [Thermoplasmata archaeon]|nr:glycosyltransferase family 4 protein [Thermoplasmata archaeon]NIS13723.1 glycosyltransferase family 4 protein [Thermoplasmata archaeon]NIS21010.1 glycosyltransferase family 4 protein [Thermoplasmata archaeon]NIU50065.1 glycosyltransferase family 4 protein [Thermoplasmata archaeon]NIV79759.1 glycosyltransferase [Thermoplasmata archaeon]
MKVLTAAIRYPPSPGGAETHAHEVAKELVSRGHDVKVYTSDLLREHPFEHLDQPYDKVDGVTVVRKRAYRLGEAFHFALMPGQLEILREPADVLHSHSFGYFHTNVMATRRKLRPTPLVITPHYHPPETMEGGWARHQMRRFYDTNIANWVFDQADVIIAVSRAELSSMAHHINDLEKVRVIPNGIHFTNFEELPEPGLFRRPRGIEGPMLLYVGRLAVNKRMEFVIEAMPELLKAHPDLQLVIAGPDDGVGEKWRELASELGVADQVRFEGFLSEEDKTAAYCDADVFVLPSEWEAFGIVLLESMACRTPCICADRGGAPEVLEDGVTGYVAPYGDVEAWTSRIKEMLDDDAGRRRMGEAGRQRVRERFVWPAIVDQIEQVYGELTGR